MSDNTPLSSNFRTPGSLSVLRKPLTTNPERDLESTASLERVRVMIADDDPSVRHLITALIGTESSLSLVGRAASAQEAVVTALAQHPDVALVDVCMPGGGVDATREIVSRCPATRVVAFSGRDDRATVLEMIGAGAAGYLVKGASDDEVIETILRSARGEANPATETSAAVILDVAEEMRHEETESRRQRERISGVLESGAIAMAFQPIANLRDGRIIGAEALARFPGEPGRPIPRWFADAAAAGLLGELELACVRTALGQLDGLPTGVFMGVNMSPETVLSAGFRETVAPFAGHGVVIEITEHAQVEDYDALGGALAEWRRAGVKLAVDDAGAGFASLRHILRLEPDIIKLDVELVKNIDTDRARRALAKSLITFGQETDATIVAEGIESNQELQALRDLGVTLGQGYYLARPAPLPLPATPIAALRAG